MRTRGSTWFDKDAMEERYGIKIKHPTAGWIDAGDGDGPFLFKTEEECDRKREELRKQTI